MQTRVEPERWLEKRPGALRRASWVARGLLLKAGEQLNKLRNQVA